MEQQYLAFTMRSLTVVILLAALISRSTHAQENSTTTPAITSTTTPSNITSPNTATAASTNASTTIASTDNITTKDSISATSATSNAATGTTNATSTMATTISSTSPPTPPGKLRPVGNDSCLNSYFDCTSNDPEFAKGNFCQPFNTNKACIKNCSAVDLDRIQYVDCQPNLFGKDGNTVSTRCQGRITECLSLSVKPESINTTSTIFKTFFCSNKDEKCMTSTTGSKINATCKSEEFKEAVKIAGCTAAHTVISSALFICLAIFTQRLLYRY